MYFSFCQEKGKLHTLSGTKYRIMNLKTIIVDDSLEARSIMELFCSKNNAIHVIASCDNAEAGLKILSEQDIDLVLLDIEMPKMTGLEFLERMPGDPAVIFTTSNETYAYAAFEKNAIDFLKKPFNYNRFCQSIDKVIKSLLQNKPEDALVSETNMVPEGLFIKEKGRYIRVCTDDVLFFENVSDYVRVFTKDKQYLIYGTLKNIAARLPQSRFLRIHRSYIINLNAIVDIEENTLVIDRTVIPIGKAHKAKLMKRLSLV